MRSQGELFESQIGLERDELAEYPKEEAAELALIVRDRRIDSAGAVPVPGGQRGAVPRDRARRPLTRT